MIFCAADSDGWEWELATEVQGVFRVNGSSRRMRELQAKFEAPPRVGIPMHVLSERESYPTAVWKIFGLEEGGIYCS
jgi:hypothetical protein